MHVNKHINLNMENNKNMSTGAVGGCNGFTQDYPP